MSKYFFDIRDDGGLIPDDDGMDLGNVTSALIEARASAEDLSRQRHGQGHPQFPSRVRIELRDEVCRVLLILPLLETFAPRNRVQQVANDSSPPVVELNF